MSQYTFASESVTRGHPDKVADQISDAFVDEILCDGTHTSRVAVEVLVKGAIDNPDMESLTESYGPENAERVARHGLVEIAGEIKTDRQLKRSNYVRIARRIIEQIGYREEDGFDRECHVAVDVGRQSPNIAQGVDRGKLLKDQGAGDQGMMFGYATKETPELMPLPIMLAHSLTGGLEAARTEGRLNWLRPDGKSQVTVVYDDSNKPLYVSRVTVSTHHRSSVSNDDIEEGIREEVIKPALGDRMRDDTVILINPTGRFEVGGPKGDSGLTGRKIIVDTYGGAAPHGGGAFSGKDPSKVDRSAAYAARWVAKNVVAAGLADKALVQLAYSIGRKDPDCVYVETFGTGRLSPGRLSQVIRDVFPLVPGEFIEALQLTGEHRPVYGRTAYGGHFGRDGFSWERLDKVNVLKERAKVYL